MDVCIPVRQCCEATGISGLIFVTRRVYITSDAATVGRKSSVSRSSRSGPKSGYYNRSGALVDEIGVVRIIFRVHALRAQLL